MYICQEYRDAQILKSWILIFMFMANNKHEMTDIININIKMFEKRQKQTIQRYIVYP